MEPKFTVPFGSKDGRIDNFDGGSSYVGDADTDTINGQLVSGGITYDASFADVLTASFKLRLDEDNYLDGRGTQADRADDRGQNQRGGDERNVHGNEADARREISGAEVAALVRSMRTTWGSRRRLSAICP